MSKKRNRITPEMSNTIAASSPLIKSSKNNNSNEHSVIPNSIQEIKINNLEKNPYQPRIEMDSQSLHELVTSIENNGLLQPIVVTKNKDSDNFTIIAGHRRFEAHKIMGKSTIKANILENIDDKKLVVLSLSENLIREDLLPIENAISIKKILDQGIVENQTKLAEYIGLSKSHISKMLSILKLPQSIIDKVKINAYKDIHVLGLINKLDNEPLMQEVFEKIKLLSRQEATKYINNNYLKKNVTSKEIFKSKTSKNKISITINISELDEKNLSNLHLQLQDISNTLNSVTKG